MDPSAPRRFTVAAFTGGRTVPSARFRLQQHVAPLRQLGIEITELPAPLGRYPPASRLLRPLWGAGAIAAQLPAVLRSYRHDVTFFQRELVSTLLTLEPLAHRPAVLDVDDAIHLRRGGRAARGIASRCELVICGNAYLAEAYARWNRHIEILPTAVDTDRYQPAAAGRQGEDQVIGWSGSSGGFPYLVAIEGALAEVLRRRPRARLLVVADVPPILPAIPPGRLEFIRWTPEVEVEALQGMAVGLMPLQDTLWARGKCSFKMLTYMSCGIPVVVSPVGMNAEVLGLGSVGLAADGTAAWVTAIEDLLSNPALGRRMGLEGRRVVLEHYSRGVIAPRLAKVLVRVVGGS